LLLECWETRSRYLWSQYGNLQAVGVGLSAGKQLIGYRYNMDLDDVALFRTITVTGSLSAAARQRGTTPMAVSRRLAALEAQLGVRLFHRTTRSLSLTSEGESFLPHAVALLEAAEVARTALAGGSSGLSGVLKLTAPNVIGHSIVVPIIAEMTADNPALSVELTLSDGIVDIAGTGQDIAIRVSPLEPSDLIATKLSDNPRILCASPSYIGRFGKPETVADLVAHPCIKLQAMETWPFRIGAELVQVRVTGPIRANTVDAVRAACLAGAGIALMTHWDVRHLTQCGELVKIELMGAELDTLGVWAVFPSREQVPARVRVLIEKLKCFLQTSATS
jgi:DNA-binding transcriptional LysR family regulator